jgi:hypothetical protein
MVLSHSKEEHERIERFLAALDRVHAMMKKRVKAHPPRTLSTLWRWYAEEIQIHRYRSRTLITPPAHRRGDWG